jgi:hypothetical protein
LVAEGDLGMSLPDKNVLVGLFLGAVSATVLSAIGPGGVIDAFAGESVTVLDPSNLVRFKDRTYSVTYEDSVSTEPVSQASVRKIGYGQTSFVQIAMTATGTYSSEALYSPNFRYPGIHVKDVPDPDHDRHSAISFWTAGAGWVSTPMASGSSFVHVRTRESSLVVNDGTTCVFTRTNSTCN